MWLSLHIVSNFLYYKWSKMLTLRLKVIQLTVKMFKGKVRRFLISQSERNPFHEDGITTSIELETKIIWSITPSHVRLWTNGLEM